MKSKKLIYRNVSLINIDENSFDDEVAYLIDIIIKEGVIK